jgi:Ras-related protein Rab-6A
LHYFVQALFRKIAAALPGMEALSSHKDDLVDVNLKPTQNPQAEGKAGGCAC